MLPSRCYCMAFSPTLLRRKCPLIKNLGSLSTLSSVNLCHKLHLYLIFLEKRFWSKKSALFWCRLILQEKSNTRWVTIMSLSASSAYVVLIPVGGGAPSHGSPARGPGVPRQEGQDGCFQHSKVVPGTVWLCCH